MTTECEAMCVELGSSWMDPIVKFIRDGKLPKDKKEVHKIRLKSGEFYLSAEGHLYKRSFTGPLLQCVYPSQVEDFLYEIHDGIYRSHVRGKSLAHRAISQGCWWPYMEKDVEAYVRKCEKCKRFVPLIPQPAKDFQSLGFFPVGNGSSWEIASSDWLEEVSLNSHGLLYQMDKG